MHMRLKKRKTGYLDVKMENTLQRYASSRHQGFVLIYYYETGIALEGIENEATECSRTIYDVRLKTCQTSYEI